MGIGTGKEYLGTEVARLMSRLSVRDAREASTKAKMDGLNSRLTSVACP